MRKTLPQLLINIHVCTRYADAMPCGPRPVLRGHGQHRSREKLLSDVASAAQRVQKLARRRARRAGQGKEWRRPGRERFSFARFNREATTRTGRFQRGVERLP
jgi:hypothetical protein